MAENKLHFAKMHSMGNDFMVVNLIQHPAEIDPAQVRHWSDRRTGIGFDQLLTLEPPRVPQHDFASRVFNADGSASGSCYNGVRCLGLLARREGLAGNPPIRIGFVGGDAVELRFAESRSTEKSSAENSSGETEVLLLTDRAQVDTGAQDSFGADARSGETVSLGGRDYQIWLATLGNPHALALADPEDLQQLEAAGAAAQTHPWFPDGVNLSFVRDQGDNSLQARTYERGTGITPACGSAAVAIASAALQLGWSESPLQVAMADADCPYRTAVLEDGRLQMSGPATLSYLGQLELSDTAKGEV